MQLNNFWKYICLNNKSDTLSTHKKENRLYLFYNFMIILENIVI